MSEKSCNVAAGVRCSVSNGSNQKAWHCVQTSMSTFWPRTASSVRRCIAVLQPGQSMTSNVSFRASMRKSIVLIFFAAATAGAANWPAHPVLHAVRVGAPPVIDGDLSDAAWATAPEFTDFTQHDPDDGKPPTMKTSVRIVYDDHAMYFGLKMDDPQRPTSLLARRDNFAQSDFISINLDPQLDRLSGNAFTIFPSNVQGDTVLYNDRSEERRVGKECRSRW